MSSNSKVNSLVKVGVLFLLVAAVTAACVGLLVQHRKLYELNRDYDKKTEECERIVAKYNAVKAANETLTENLKKLHEKHGKSENEHDSARREDKQQFESRMSSLTNDLAAARNKCKVESDARKRTEAEVKKLTESMKKKDETIKKLDESIRKLNESVKKKDESIRKLNESINKSNGAMKTLKEKMKELRAERDEILQELASAVQPAASEEPSAKATSATQAPAVQQKMQPMHKDPDDVILRQPPPEDNLTPEEREARNKAEFDELIRL